MIKARSFKKYPPALERAITVGATRLCAALDRQMPLSAKQIKTWLVYLAGSEKPEAYYLRRGDLPMFLFPWFLEQAHGAPDQAFLRERVYSTLNGFYFIRLLDDVTDHHAMNEVALLPALALFQTEFQSPYQQFFAAEHPFWNYYRRTWFHSADVTMRDLSLRTVSRKQFQRIAAQKTCAVKIPIAAAAFHYGCEDALQRWARFMDVYGCWHQMSNDLFHWHEDLSLGTATFFLSEAARQKRAGETIPAWVIRQGFGWGIGLLDEWMGEARERARETGSKDIVRYVEYRDAKLRREANATLKNLQSAAKLGDILLA